MRQYGTTNVAESATAPSVDVVGSTYYNTADKRLYVSDGTAWQPHDVPAGGTTGQLLAKIDGNDWATQWTGPFGSMANQSSSAVSITGGSITGITDLAIADGGTAASTKLAAFDNLSPTTTRGDLIVRDASNNVRLGLGAAGTILRSDGSDAGWATLATAGIQAADQDLTDIAALTRTRGALMVGGASAWTALAVGGAGTVLRSDGTDAAWASLATAGIQAADQDLTDIAALTRTQGDLLLGGASAWTRLPIGANTTVLQSNGTTASWVALSGLGFQTSDQDLTDIAALTRARGDLIVGGASAWTRLAISATAGSVLRSNGTDLAYVQDLSLPTMTASNAGTATGGFLAGSQIILRQSYTQSAGAGTAAEGSGGVGVAVKSIHAAVLDDTTGGIFPITNFTHGDGAVFGPNGIFQQAGYVTYNHTNSIFSFTPIAMAAQITARSKPNTDMNMTPSWGYISGHSVLADGGNVTLTPNDTSPGGIGAAGGGPGAFIDNWAYWTVNGGTINTTSGGMYHRGFVSAPAWLGAITFAGRVAFDVHDVNITGNSALLSGGLPAIMGGGVPDTNTTVMGTQFGLRIPRLVRATTNFGISCDSKVALWTDTSTFTTNPEDAAVVRVAGTHTFNVPSNAGGITAFLLGGTWKIAQATSGFGFLQGFGANPVIVSDGTASGTLLPTNSIFTSAATYRADSTAVTMTAINSYRASPTFDVTGGGALTVTTATGFEATATVSAGATVGDLRAFHVSNPNSGASITNLYGILIDSLTRGGTLNWGIYSSTKVLLPEIYGADTASGDLLLHSSTDATKGRIWLQDPKVQIGTSGTYTHTSGNYTVLSNSQTTTMNASGGGAGTGNYYAANVMAPTVTFAQAGNGLTSVSAFVDNTAVQNSSGVAITLGGIGSYSAGTSITAVGSGGSLTIPSWSGYVSTPTLARTSTATVTLTALQDFYAFQSNIATGTTVTARYAFRVADANVTGVLTTQYGVYVPALAAGTTNYGVYSLTQNVLAGGVYGDIASGASMTIASTAHATKGPLTIDASTLTLMPSSTSFSGSAAVVSMAYAQPITMGQSSANLWTGLYFHPTVTHTAASFALGGTGSALFATSYTNSGAFNIVGVTDFQINPNLNADTSARTTTVYTALQLGPAAGTSASGTLAITTWTTASIIPTLNSGVTATTVYGANIGPTVNTGATATTLKHINLVDAAGAGTVTTQIGIDIPAFAKGGTNHGIRNAAVLTQSGASTFTGTMTITDVNIVLSTGTGTRIGTAVGQKLGFYNAVPIIQPSSANQAAAPAGGTGATAGAYDTAAHRDALIALVNEMRNVLVNLGLMKGSA